MRSPDFGISKFTSQCVSGRGWHSGINSAVRESLFHLHRREDQHATQQEQDGRVDDQQGAQEEELHGEYEEWLPTGTEASRRLTDTGRGAAGCFMA